MKYIVTTNEKSTYLEVYRYCVEAESEEEAESKVRNLDYEDSELIEQYFESGELEEITDIDTEEE